MKNVAPIEDLLAKVDAKMLAGYERRENVLLYPANFEYQNALAKRTCLKKLDEKSVLVTLCQSHIVLGILLVSAFFSNPIISRISLAMIVALAIRYILHLFIQKRRDAGVAECASAIEKHGAILEKFRKAVDGLNPCHVTVREYTPESVRDILIGLAARIIEAEHKFDAVRQQKERRTYDVLHLGNWLVGCQEDLTRARRCALEFDLDFSNSELFAKAGERIEQTNLLLASQK